MKFRNLDQVRKLNENTKKGGKPKPKPKGDEDWQRRPDKKRDKRK